MLNLRTSVTQPMGELALLAFLSVVAAGCGAGLGPDSSRSQPQVTATTPLLETHEPVVEVSTGPTNSPKASPTFLTVPAGPFPASMVEGLVVEADVPFTDVVKCGGLDCQVPLDVLAPTEGDELPTFVFVHGGPAPFQDRRYMDLLSTSTARRGAVVFLTSYRSPATRDGPEEGLLDIRCAVRFAQENTATHGGDPENVILVGHSYGSLLAIQTAINNDVETPGCSADADGIPEAVVGLSSFNTSVQADAESGPPLILVGGSLDYPSLTGEQAAEKLRDAGFDAEFRVLEGVTHEGMVDPATPGVLDALFEAAALAGN